MPKLASKFAACLHPALALLFVLASICPPAGAAASRFTPIDLHHTSWTAKDGAPSSIIAIAQTPDRWLWLASLSGIWRFDGVRFERFAPAGAALPGGGIWSMRLLRSGGLWIGHRQGGASLWRDGRLRNFGREQGLPLSSTLDFEEDGRGRTWAATARGLYLFDGSRWAQAGAESGAPSSQCTLLTDRAATMWAQCESGAFKLARGASAFEKVAGPAGLGRLALAPDQTVWSVGGPRGEMAAIGGPGRVVAAPPWPRPRTSGGAMLFERDGRHVWATRADGLVRAGPDGGGATFGSAHGLSGSMPNCLFEDVEGNVWVGTENGLDRFRRAALSGVALPQIFADSPAIAAGSDGVLWVGATRLAHPGMAAFEALPPEREGSAVLALGADEAWIGAQDGLWHVQGGRRQRIPLPPEVHYMQFLSIAREPDGALWVVARRAGALRWRDGAWQRGGGHAALLGEVQHAQAGRGGRMWFGFGDGSVKLLEAGVVRSFGRADGLDVGQVRQVLDAADGAWIAGAKGVARFDGRRGDGRRSDGRRSDGRRFMPLLGAGGEALPGVSGIVEDHGALWLNGTAGITVVAGAERARFVRDGGPVALRLLDHKDGLRGVATNSFPLPSAVAGSDGTLWFANSAGLFWLRPGELPRKRLAPPVEILALRADGASLPLHEGRLARLQPNPGRIQLDYTALGLTMPERMHFQYRLDGVDRGWQDGGPARMAEYTDLGPGSYTFRVKASNEDGVWSERDAVLDLEVAPAFYQTAWFRLLCGAALAAGLWTLYRRRLARAARLASERTEARLHERERIARELHDTVLQTVQGLMLQVDAACQQLPPDAPARAGIERSLRRAAAGIDEGRDKVLDLRQHAGDQPDLVGHVCAAVCAEVPPGMRIDGASRGAPRRLAPEVFAEVSALAREALRNALRHAGAAHVSVQADYGDDVFTLAVADDGCGIPHDVLEAGARAGHWGLVGMRERACRIGAELALDSMPGGGTRVALRLAAARAYG